LPAGRQAAGPYQRHGLPRMKPAVKVFFFLLPRTSSSPRRACRRSLPKRERFVCCGRKRSFRKQNQKTCDELVSLVNSPSPRANHSPELCSQTASHDNPQMRQETVPVSPFAHPCPPAIISGRPWINGTTRPSAGHPPLPSSCSRHFAWFHAGRVDDPSGLGWPVVCDLSEGLVPKKKKKKKREKRCCAVAA
jgi:hypothetical protein